MIDWVGASVEMYSWVEFVVVDDLASLKSGKDCATEDLLPADTESSVDSDVGVATLEDCEAMSSLLAVTIED